MEFRILGPLEVVDDAGVVEIPPGKPRALLALLVLEAGRVVSAERLIDELWGERPPATAAKMVQGHVSRLRKALPAGLLETRRPGICCGARSTCSGSSDSVPRRRTRRRGLLRSVCARRSS